tara:strand:- start:165 stop:488 length:324 start_codon:yes stop_codon:yes gene_type:complete
MNKSLFTYSIISFIVISFFGFKFLLGLLGNILILLFLTPLLLVGLAFLGLNTFKSKFKVCANCGTTMISNNETCLYCGSKFNGLEDNKIYSEDASSETIEIEAEEIN